MRIKVKLGDGNKMPMLGLGACKASANDLTSSIVHAMKVGYRHFDTAQWFGNEADLGEAFRQGMEELRIPRSELFITGKFMLTGSTVPPVETMCTKTLTNLGLEYLDLYLMCWPEHKQDLNEENEQPCDVIIPLTWKCMEAVQAKGLCKSIGVGNFDTDQLQLVKKSADRQPVINQIECHPYRNQRPMIEFCRGNNIYVTARCPLANPPKTSGLSAIDQDVLDDATLTVIGQIYQKSPRQVALKWQVQRGVIIIPDTVDPAEIDESIGLTGFRLTEEEMELIESLNVEENLM